MFSTTNTSLRKCAFLSMDSLEAFTSDDDLTIQPLRERGWAVETVSWRNQNANWNDYEAVIVRSPWDYQDEATAFLRALETIEQSSARLYNSLSLMRWNMRKTYLRQLAQCGIAIVPTLWSEDGISFNTDAWFDALQTDEIVVKPVVSANADFTYRIDRNDALQFLQELAGVFRDRAFMVQPFMRTIVEEGEFSLFYFNGAFSHAILKTPKSDDFRVQEEHGGYIREIKPDARLLQHGEHAFKALLQCGFKAPEDVPLYFRADFVRLDATNDAYAVMELELIEPALYLRMNAGAPERFADAVAERLTTDSTKRHER